MFIRNARVRQMSHATLRQGAVMHCTITGQGRRDGAGVGGNRYSMNQSCPVIFTKKIDSACFGR